jgi:hypothetical protein
VNDDLSHIAADILSRANYVEEHPDAIGVFSTGEAIAVALVLDRKDLLEGRTILEAIERLGPEWTRAALQAQRVRSQARRCRQLHGRASVVE